MADSEQSEIESGFIYSKFGRVLLTIVSVLLIFAAPTYGIWLLTDIIHVSLVAAFAVGFILFVIGMVLMWFLVRKKIIT